MPSLPAERTTNCILFSPMMMARNISLVIFGLLFLIKSHGVEWVQEKDGGPSAVYVTEQGRFTVFISDGGTLYYMHPDGTFREPSREAVQEIYHVRSKELANGETLSLHRRRFLENATYKSLFTPSSNLKNQKIEIKSGVVYEKNEISGETHRIIQLSDGRLAYEEKTTSQGKSISIYRTPGPSTLSQLMERYATKPSSFHSILNQRENVRDHAFSHQEASKSPRPEAKSIYPVWVADSNAKGEYLRALEDYPSSPKKDYTTIGLSARYSNLRNELDQLNTELLRMSATGAAEEHFQSLGRKAQACSDALHREWSDWLMKKGLDIPPVGDLRNQYSRDLKDWHQASLARRYTEVRNKVENQRTVERANHRPKQTKLLESVGPNKIRLNLLEPLAQWTNKDDTQARLSAINDLLKDAETTPGLKQFTLKRLEELSATDTQIRHWLMGQKFSTGLQEASRSFFGILP